MKRRDPTTGGSAPAVKYPPVRGAGRGSCCRWGDYIPGGPPQVAAWTRGDGRRMSVEEKTKKDLAVEFINGIRNMDPTALNSLIVKEAGEDLAQFFLSYSANLISKDPSRVLENTSSLMLMGYLIRA